MEVIVIIDHEYSYFIISFHYDPELVEAIKKLPNRKYNPALKHWTVPEYNRREVLQFAAKFGFTFTTKAKCVINGYKNGYHSNNFSNGNTNQFTIFSKKEHNIRSIIQKSLEAITPKLPDLSTITINTDLSPTANIGLFQHQIDTAKLLVHYKRGILAHDMGLGKAIPDSERVLTPNGWVKHGFIKPGDMVIGYSGKPVKVLQTFRNEPKKYYRVTFSDDFSVECCEEHLWAIQTNKENLKKGIFSVKSLRSIITEYGEIGSNHKEEEIFFEKKVYIPLVEPVEFVNKPVSFDPYKFGVLLSSKNYLKGSEVGNLKKLFHKRNKHIPDEYKYNSLDIRLELLRGISDTIASIKASGTLVYLTRTKRFSKDLIELLQSFGAVAIMKSEEFIRKRKKAKSRGTGYTYTKNQIYYVVCNFPPTITPFKNGTKTAIWEITDKRFPVRYIKEIRYSRIAKGQCLLVDSPDHLYVIRHYVVTHNTLCSLVAAKNLGHPVIVVCPATMIDNWKKEANIASVSLSGIWSYNKMPSEFQEPYTLIADEAHAFQNLHSQRTQKFLKLADKASAVFAITGTPMKNGRPINLMPLLMACKHETVKDKTYYQIHYCGAKRTRWSKWDCNGAKNLEELHARTKDVIFRKTKEECLDLPEKIRHKVKVNIADETRYKKEIDQIIEQLFIEVPDVSLITRQQAMGFMTRLRRLDSLQKIPGTCEIIDEILEQNHKVVIFTAFLDTAHIIAKKYNGLILTGETPVSHRQGIIDEFQNNPAKMVFVSTFGTGGLGVTLTAATNVILIDRTFVPADAEQSEARVHRIGCKGTVLSQWIQLNELDEKIDRILEAKEENIELVLDGKRKTINKKSPEDIALAFIPTILNNRRYVYGN